MSDARMANSSLVTNNAVESQVSKYPVESTRCGKRMKRSVEAYGDLITVVRGDGPFGIVKITVPDAHAVVVDRVGQERKLLRFANSKILTPSKCIHYNKSWNTLGYSVCNGRNEHFVQFDPAKGRKSLRVMDKNRDRWQRQRSGGKGR